MLRPFVRGSRVRGRCGVRITVHNIGPVKAATIELRPLTVFIGPNNSGKSHMAAILCALAETDGFGLRASCPAAQSLSPSSGQRNSRDLRTESAEAVLASELSRLTEAFAARTPAELERLVGVPAQRLRRVRKRPMKAVIAVESEDPDWGFQTSIGSSAPRTSVTQPGVDQVLRSVAKPDHGQAQAAASGAIPANGAGELARGCFQDFPRRAHVIPASRSALLRTQQIIVTALIRQAPLASIRQSEFPALSGIATDFLGSLNEIDTEVEGPFAAAATELEEQILKGTLRVSPDHSAAQRVRYVTGRDEYPLAQASSAVTELAPLVLFLRHVLRPGDLLVIEEPESHLHPNSQIVLAKSLIRLANAGLTVLLTTHSAFFLQQIGDASRAVSGPRSLASTLGMGGEVAIDPDSVGIHLFEQTQDGTEVRPVAMLGRGGDESGIDQVFSPFYDELVALDMGP